MVGPVDEAHTSGRGRMNTLGAQSSTGRGSAGCEEFSSVASNANSARNLSMRPFHMQYPFRLSCRVSRRRVEHSSTASGRRVRLLVAARETRLGDGAFFLTTPHRTDLMLTRAPMTQVSNSMTLQIFSDLLQLRFLLGGDGQLICGVLPRYGRSVATACMSSPRTTRRRPPRRLVLLLRVLRR